MRQIITRVVSTTYMLGVLGITSAFTGCAGFSQQLQATTTGIKIEYKVPQETLPVPHAPVRVVIKDDRLDSEVLGVGARSTVGSRVLGLFAFGVVSLVVPSEPSFQQTDLVGMFQKAFEERLKSNGVEITRDSAANKITLEVVLRDFRLDFNFGKWIGEAGYVITMKEDSKVICEDRISEKVVRFNVWGYGSGEAALSEAFAKAVNRANLNGCLSRLKN